MTKKKNYYEILGLQESCSQDDIKKAYKRLAMKYHPDRNKSDNAEEKFKEINEANSVLSDPKQRKIYDLHGITDFKGGEDIFSNIYSRFTTNANSFFTNTQSPETRQIGIEITLMDTYNGVKKDVKINVNKKCDECDGYGTCERKYVADCETCNGVGHINQIKNIGIIQISTGTIPCSDCNCTGKKPIPEKFKCAKCNSKMTIYTEDNISLDLKPGLLDNYVVKYNNKGDFNPKTRINDHIELKFSIKNDTFFKREGINLVYTKDISIASLFCGIDFVIKHLNGDLINIKYDKILRHDETLISPNNGLPDYYEENTYGDLIIRFNIKYPYKIDPKYKPYIEKMLYVPINQKACLEGENLKKINTQNNKYKIKKLKVFNETHHNTTQSNTTPNNSSDKTNDYFSSNEYYYAYNDNEQQCTTQ